MGVFMFIDLINRRAPSPLLLHFNETRVGVQVIGIGIAAFDFKSIYGNHFGG